MKNSANISWQADIPSLHRGKQCGQLFMVAG
jgi:hypothetical protein